MDLEIISMSTQRLTGARIAFDANGGGVPVSRRILGRRHAVAPMLFETPGPKKMSISVTDPRNRLIQEDDVSHDVRDAMNEFGVYGVQLNLEFSAMAIGDYGRYLFDLKVDVAVIGQVALLIIEKPRT